MNEDDRWIVIRKGDAFTRYFFIDRGEEKDLTTEQAMEDFENYIYAPISEHVSREIIYDVVNEAVGIHLENSDKKIADLTEDDMDSVAAIIGIGVLYAYNELNKRA